MSSGARFDGEPQQTSPLPAARYSGTCSRHHFSKRPGGRLRRSLVSPVPPADLGRAGGPRGRGAKVRLRGFPCRGRYRPHGPFATVGAPSPRARSAAGTRPRRPPSSPDVQSEQGRKTSPTSRSGIPSGRQAGRGGLGHRDPEMRRGRRPPARALLFLLLARLSLPGDGNQASITGSCPCDKSFSSRSPPTPEYMEHFRKHLRDYQRCPHYIRFQLHSRSVCGHSKDQWVLSLMRCYDKKECGRAYLGSQTHQQHLPPPSTQAHEPTERAPSETGTSVQTFLLSTLQSSQQPTLPAGVPSLNKGLTFPNETTIPILHHSLGAEPASGENQKQQVENLGPTAGSSAVVPVLSLLAIIFILAGVLLYVLCKRRREQSLQYSPDLQFHYTPMAVGSQCLNQPLTRIEAL
ncbi:C-X-C motif chemokine 16 [Tamandua tetradactyla]|uniref:C-X-C motif chemokine 16 n=1 Tax=Tamandua tetradactyla TaxID=48850 RepID=UPI0040540B24